MSTGTSSNFPKARTADLITERVGDELVVYDGKSSEAHCLSRLASAVFVAADGKTSTADLAAIASRQIKEPVDVPAVEHALAELEDRGLVELGGISRRGFMQRSAAVGGAAFAATMVTSVVAPAYGTAASNVLPVGFSEFMIVVYDSVNGDYYTLKWDQSNPPGTNGTGTTTTTCGSFDAGHPCNTAWQALVGTLSIQSSCPLFTVTAEINYDSNGNAISVTVTLPSASYTVEYWMFHYGNTQECGNQCPDNFSSENTTKHGTITIPICA